MKNTLKQVKVIGYVSTGGSAGYVAGSSCQCISRLGQLGSSLVVVQIG